MFSSLLDLVEVLDSGDVERYHAVPRVAAQNLASHQWRTVMILLYLKPDARKELILATLLHDAAEIWTGDVPFHVKKAGDSRIKKLIDIEEDKWFEKVGIPDFKLTESEKLLMKICDCIEGMQYCSERVRCGEEKALVPWEKWLNLLLTTGLLSKGLREPWHSEAEIMVYNSNSVFAKYEERSIVRA